MLNVCFIIFYWSLTHHGAKHSPLSFAVSNIWGRGQIWKIKGFPQIGDFRTLNFNNFSNITDMDLS